MARTDPQFNVRMPAEIKQKLTELASVNHRSINAEIIAAIQAWIELHGSKLEVSDPFHDHYLHDVVGSWQRHQDELERKRSELDFAIKVLSDYRDETKKHMNKPLETLKQNRPAHKTRKDK